MSMNQYKKSIKKNLTSLFGEMGQEIFDANFPKQTKEEIKKEKDRERIIQILELLQHEPNRITPKMIKDAKRISGIIISKPKKKK